MSWQWIACQCQDPRSWFACACRELLQNQKLITHTPPAGGNVGGCFLVRMVRADIFGTLSAEIDEPIDIGGETTHRNEIATANDSPTTTAFSDRTSANHSRMVMASQAETAR